MPVESKQPDARKELRNNLSTLLKPRSLVCVGGSQALGCIKASRRSGFKGKIWVVNPKIRPVEGATSVASVFDIPTPPDAALIALSAEKTPKVVSDLAKIGTKGAVSIASGFAEVDEKGKKLQEEIKKASGSMAFLGPNGMGMINFFDGIAVWGSDNHMNKVEGDGAAFISQSGAFLYNSSNVENGFPMGYAISTGNQAVIDLSDCIDVVLRDKRVRAIGIYIEGISDAQSLGKACWKAVQKKVPIIALRGTSNKISEKATSSHTGSMIVDDGLWEAFKMKYCIVEVKTPKALVETLKLITISGIPKGNRIGAVTYSGGLNNLIASQASEHGLALPDISISNKKKLKSIMPSTVPIANPFDMNFPFSSRSGISMENGEAIAEAINIFAKGMADILVFFIDIPRKGDLDIYKIWLPSIENLDFLTKKLKIPIVVGAPFPEGIEPEIRQTLIKKGVAPLLGFSEILTALGTSASWKEMSKHLTKKKYPKLVTSLKKSKLKSNIKNEFQSKNDLKVYGINFPKYKKTNKKNISKTLNGMRYPVALKILSNKISHKSAMGGVKLNLINESYVLKASAEIEKSYTNTYDSNFPSEFLLEEMVTFESDEYIIGAKKDSTMGLSVIFGKGGTNVEANKDFRILLSPIATWELKTVLESYKIKEGSKPFRELKKMICMVEKYAITNFKKFRSLDLNPVVITNKREALALDALLIRE